MISQKKLEANRRNAQKSTGPKTEAGKAAVSRNALKHGLTARSTSLLPTEDPALYDAYIAGILDRYRCPDPVQTSLILRLAHLSWQLGRAPAAFAAVLDQAHLNRVADTERDNRYARLEAQDSRKAPDLKPLPAPLPPAQTLADLFMHRDDRNPVLHLQAYETTLSRDFSRTLQQLLHLRKLAADIEATEPPAPLENKPTAESPAPTVQDQATEPSATPSSPPENKATPPPQPPAPPAAPKNKPTPTPAPCLEHAAATSMLSRMTTPSHLSVHRLSLGLAILLTICLLALPVRAQTRPATQPARQISWVNPKLPAGPGLSHHVLASKAMGRDVGYVVWTPSGYDEKADQRYPVIYFLHGAGGNESADSGGFSGYVAQAIKKGTLPPVICVFPNGGMSGYRGDVEKMILDELIPLIDQSYRTIAKPASRAMAGFSMGGAGATRLVITHPDLFCASASWGGGARPGDTALEGAAAANAETLKKNKVGIMMVKGDRDQPQGNEDFAKQLDKLGIDNELIILKDTNHDLGLYYQRSAEQMMQFLGKHIAR